MGKENYSFSISLKRTVKSFCVSAMSVLAAQSTSEYFHRTETSS